MKIRTPDCQCLICHEDGRIIIRSRDQRGTYFAIKKMRQLLDAMAAEQELRAAEAALKPG